MENKINSAMSVYVFLFDNFYNVVEYNREKSFYHRSGQMKFQSQPIMTQEKKRNERKWIKVVYFMCY